MSNFVQVLSDTESRHAMDWLGDYSAASKALWRDTPLPDRKTENWKYTSIQPLLEDDCHSGSSVSEVLSDEELEVLRKRIPISGLEAASIVFVDGDYSQTLSSERLPDGVEYCSFAGANDTQRAVIKQHLGSVLDIGKHQFASLNGTCLDKAIFINVQKNCTVNTPLHIIYMERDRNEAFAIQQRSLILLGESSSVEIIEHFVGATKDQKTFVNGVSEFKQLENSNLKHARFHVESEKAMHIGGVHIGLSAHAKHQGFHFGLGGDLKRIDIQVHHQGQGTECKLNGIYMARDRQKIDYHATIDHEMPQGKTQEVFRGIIADTAKAVFNGRIHIHKDAQKVVAELSNKNLLLNKGAEIDTKPELEIYADDVQCAHGATIAQIDEKSLYYMRSRGIDRSSAELLLAFGFVNEVIETLDNSTLQTYVRKQAQRLFAERNPSPAIALNDGVDE